MGIFFWIMSVILSGVVGSIIRDEDIETMCNTIKVIEIKNVKYRCEVLPEQKLNWTPSKAK